MQILKTPDEWQQEMPEIQIIDRDGWRNKGDDWNKPITKQEYIVRRAHCTCSFSKSNKLSVQT